MEAGDLVGDGAIATSRRQAERLWSYREIMVEMQGGGGRYLRTDVSVPISQIPRFITEAVASVRAAYPEAQPLAYGHVGDGNVHLNVIPPKGLAPEAMDGLFHGAEEVIFEVVDRIGGSISAEHGIGRVKQEAYLERIGSVELDLARRVKDAFDPRHILSIGRILPVGTAADE